MDWWSFARIGDDGRQRTSAAFAGAVVSRTLRGGLSFEVQLVRTRKLEAVGQLAGVVAHDVNDLPAVILGTTQLVVDALGTEHPVIQELEIVESAAGRGAELTTQLLLNLASNVDDAVGARPRSHDDLVRA